MNSSSNMIVHRVASAVRYCAWVCLIQAACWHGTVIDGSEADMPVAEKPSIKLKIGALFDVRAQHLVEAFQLTVDKHNEEQTEVQGAEGDLGTMNFLPRRYEDSVRVLFEPVITFVDVTDSFAVSNAMCDLIAHDVMAIVGITNASSLPTIQSYSATFHVPFLSLGSSQNVTSSAPFQLSLRPPIMAAIVDLLNHLGCSSALYMYDSDEGLMRIQDLFQAINIRELYLELDVRRIGDRAHVTEISKIIGSLHPRREICLVLDVERVDAKGVVSVVDGNAPTVKDIILVTLDADLAINSLLQGPELHPASFNVSGLQLVPTLHPSPSPHLSPLTHPSPNFQKWPLSPLPGSDKQADFHEQNIRTGLSKELEHNQHLKLNPVGLGKNVGDISEEKHRSKRPDGDDNDSLYKQNSRTVSKSDSSVNQYDSISNTNSDEDRYHYRSKLSSKPGPSSQSGFKLEEKENINNEKSYIGSFSGETGSPRSDSPENNQIPAKEGTQSQTVRSSEALISDCLKVLKSAFCELWDSLGDVLKSSSEVSQADMSIKCTNFVVEKKKYGADLMEALRLVHIQGETRYISFDTGGKREDYTLSVLSLPAQSSVIRNEGEWSSVTGLTSHTWSHDGVRSYTIFGNVSRQSSRRILLGVTE